MASTKPVLLPFIEKGELNQANFSLIWLHGLGADGNDFLSVVQELNFAAGLGVRFIFPHAPMRRVTINYGQTMRAWYDIFSVGTHARQDVEGIQASVQAIHHLIDYEIQRGVSSDHIMLAGFSQGAAMSLLSGLHYPKKLGGIIALSGYLPPIMPWNELIHPMNKNIPIFMAHGTDDIIVSIVYGQASYDVLKKEGLPVTYKTYPMGHSVCEEEIGDIKRWLNPLFS